MCTAVRCIHAFHGIGFVLVLSCALACSFLPGCATPDSVRRTLDAPLYDDVVRIRAFMRSKPWLNFDPAHPARVNGLAVNVYLVSASTQKGVFGAGTIRVVMFEDLSGSRGRDAGGKVDLEDAIGKKLYEWELTPEQATPYRVLRRANKKHVLGDGYQLRLSWGDLDLAGKNVALQLEYVRGDGQRVVRKPFWLQIPRSA